MLQIDFKSNVHNHINRHSYTEDYPIAQQQFLYIRHVRQFFLLFFVFVPWPFLLVFSIYRFVYPNSKNFFAAHMVSQGLSF